MSEALNWSGIWIPLVTPFREGRVDTVALARLVRHCAAQGAAGFVPCGSTGEAAMLDAAEQDQVLSTTLDAAGGLPVVMGLSGVRPAAVAARARQLADAHAGLAGFLVGQTINAWAVVAIKERTKERHLWARLIGSTFAGQFGDTLVFCAIAAAVIGISSFHDFIVYAALGWFYKTAVEVFMLPVTYRVIATVKRREPSYQPML